MRVGAVPGEEQFHGVAVADHQAGRQHDLGHVVDVAHRDQAFHPVEAADGDGEGEHHGEAGVDGAGDEVGREDGGVPAGNHRHREVEAHHRVHREHQWRRQAGENQRGHFVTVPVAGRTAPAERERAVNAGLDLRHRAVAHRRQVGDEADIPEHDRDGGVGRDGEHVPDQRALELRPQAHGVGIGEQPVGRQPRTAGVEHGEDRRAGHREDGHRFGEAADRHAPLLLEQQQDGGDQRAGVADADPPDEVDDVERPADGDVVAPDADALEQQVAEGHLQHARQAEGNQQDADPAEREALGQRNLRDGLGDRLEVVPRQDDRRLFEQRGVVRVIGH